MIAFLEGKIAKITPTFLWMDVQGVGYEVFISLNTYESIQSWEKGLLFIHHQCREDSETLYGFFDEKEKGLFQHLISVSGVGAATARVMLSGAKPQELISAILNDDNKALEKVKGIGAKTAKRIILELREKLGKEDYSIDLTVSPSNKLSEDALNALMSLGIARNSAQNAVQKVLKSGDFTQVEEVIKLALKLI